VPLAMIGLVIPTRDRKLVHWGKWARRHRPDIVELLINCDCGINHRPCLNDHYCYFGVVPPSAFRDVYRLKGVGGGVVKYERMLPSEWAATREAAPRALINAQIAAPPFAQHSVAPHWWAAYGPRSRPKPSGSPAVQRHTLGATARYCNIYCTASHSSKNYCLTLAPPLRV